MISKKTVDDAGNEHWHGPVDYKVWNLATDFVAVIGGCANCLATQIQIAIEDYESDVENKNALASEDEPSQG